MGAGEPTSPDARRPGMLDVARVAGVSHQTVSRVLNQHPNVRAETRERVQAAIRELGYRRNSAARALVTSRSGTIGVLTPSSALYGPVRTLHSVEQAAREAGLFVSLASLRSADESILSDDILTAAMSHFMDQSVEGIIVIAPVPGVAKAAAELASRLPIVVVTAGESAASDLQSVGVDQAGGARAATRHLLDLGHRDIVHLSGPSDWFDASARLTGWAAQLRAAGRPMPEPLVGDWSAESGARAAEQLLDRRALPTAVFAANDQMALGLVKVLTDRGVRVPEDVSVVGFDDSDGSAYFRPSLTTLTQDFDELGRLCVDRMLSLLKGAPETGPTLVHPTLVVRESTAPPRTGPAAGRILDAGTL